VNVLALLLTSFMWLPFVATGQPVKWGAGVPESQSTVHCEDVYRIGATWMQSWSRIATRCWDVEAVPRVQFADQAGLPISGTSAYLLGITEPDQASNPQTPDQAAIAHRTMEDTYPKMLIGTPGVARVDYLRQWRAAYVARYGTPPRNLHFIDAHIYSGSLAQSRVLLAGFVALSNEWNLPLWVTEWNFVLCADPNAVADAKAFARDLEANPKVARHAWFASRYRGDEPWCEGSCRDPQCNGSLFSATTGQPTIYGKLFVR
jgi:hypothetical protein